MKKLRPAPAGAARARKDDSAVLRQLAATLAAIDPNGSPSQLVKQVVKAAAAQPGVVGARLWRMADGEPSVWQQTGKLAAADGVLAAKVFRNHSRVPRERGMWIRALRSNGRVVGVLEARGSAALPDSTRQRLELFSHYAGVALSHTEKRRAVEELSGIVEATKRLNSTLDLGELINIILQLASRHTDADRGTVFLVDKERDEIWSLVGLGLYQQEIRIPTGRGIAGWVARNGETVNLKDAYTDDRFERDVDRRLNYRTQTVLCLPIRNKDAEIIGVLQLLNKRDGAFTSADESFLRALSDHVALALENARLHRESIARQRMERDLALARSIQSGLLPEQPPRIEGFDIAVSHKPSQMVGGDYYDFVSLNADTTLAVIADVEGKGVASALVMANLQATLRALVAHLHSLERLASSVNDMIVADTRALKFMTMFVAMLDQRHRALHYINAGHVPPAVVRADGEVVFLREGGMVMGVFPGVPYERGYMPLSTGDTFVTCTDGITEAMDVKEEEYGLERLVEAVQRQRHLPAEQIVQNVLAEVDQFSRGGPHEDDRVIFILKVL